jgi:hypothetical protein
MSTTQATPQRAAAAPKNDKTIEQRVIDNRKFLQEAWTKEIQGKLTSDLCKAKWNSWSPSVRLDFTKRAQKAVLAAVKKDLPKKQWAQWDVTLRFCLDDIFNKANERNQVNWEAENGVEALVKMINDSKENINDAEKFQAKIEEMLEEMKVFDFH